jgi:hypothetical protein
MTPEGRITELEENVANLSMVVQALCAEVEELKAPALTLRDAISARQAEIREARR